MQPKLLQTRTSSLLATYGRASLCSLTSASSLVHGQATQLQSEHRVHTNQRVFCCASLGSNGFPPISSVPSNLQNPYNIIADLVSSSSSSQDCQQSVMEDARLNHAIQHTFTTSIFEVAATECRREAPSAATKPVESNELLPTTSSQQDAMPFRTLLRQRSIATRALNFTRWHRATLNAMTANAISAIAGTTTTTTTTSDMQEMHKQLGGHDGNYGAMDTLCIVSYDEES